MGLSYSERRLGRGATVNARAREEQLRASSTTVDENAFSLNPTEAFDASETERFFEEKIGKEALSAMADEIGRAMEAEEDLSLTVKEQSAGAHRVKILDAKKALQALTIDARKEKIISDLKEIFTQLKPQEDGNAPATIALKEDNIVAAYLEGKEALVRIFDEENRLKPLEGKAAKHISREHGSRPVVVMYEVNRWMFSPIATGVNVGTATVDLAAMTGAIASISPGWIPPFFQVAAAAGTVGVQASLKQGAERWVDLLPITRTGASIAALVGIIAPVAATNILKASMTAGAGADIAATTGAKAREARQNVDTTRAEVKAYPAEVRRQFVELFRNALKEGGDGHGIRTARVVQILSGDHFIDPATGERKSNRDSYSAFIRGELGKARDVVSRDKRGREVRSRVPGISGKQLEDEISARMRSFDDMVRDVKAFHAKQGIPDDQGFLWLVEREMGKIDTINPDAALGQADRFGNEAQQIGNSDLYTELIAGFSKTFGEIFSSKLYADIYNGEKSWTALPLSLLHIFAHQSVDLGTLKPLNEQAVAAMEKLAEELQRFAPTLKLEEFVSRMQESNIAWHVDAQGKRTNLIPQIQLTKPRFTLTPELARALRVEWGPLASVVEAKFIDRVIALATAIPDDWKPYIARGFNNTYVPLLGKLNIDAKQEGLESKILMYLGLTLFMLFYLPAILRIGTSKVDHWARGKIREQDDEYLSSVEGKIADALLIRLRSRERNIYEAGTRAGLVVHNVSSDDETAKDALMSLLRKHALKEISVDAGDEEAMSLFQRREGKIPEKYRKTYGARLDEFVRDLREDKTGLIAHQLLDALDPQSARLEQTIASDLRLLADTKIPEVRNGLGASIQTRLLTYRDASRREEILSLRKMSAYLNAVVEFLRTEIAGNESGVDGVVSARLLLMEEALQVVERDVLIHERSALLLHRQGDSVPPVDAHVLSADERNQILRMVETNELENIWKERSVDGTRQSDSNLAESAEEHTKLWRSVLVTNADRLKEKYAAAVQGGVVVQDVSIERRYEPAIGGATVVFVDRRSGQSMSFDRVIPGTSLSSTTEVVNALEDWLGNEKTMSVHKFISALTTRRRELDEYAREAGGEIQEGKIFTFSSVLLQDNQSLVKINELVTKASIVAQQQAILERMQRTKKDLTIVEQKIMSTPETSRFKGIFSGNLANLLGTFGADTMIQLQIEEGAAKIKAPDGTERTIYLYRAI